MSNLLWGSPQDLIDSIDGVANGDAPALSGMVDAYAAIGTLITGDRTVEQISEVQAAIFIEENPDYNYAYAYTYALVWNQAMSRLGGFIQ